MFGIGLPELILIMAVALVVVGPEKLPDLAKTLARQFVELKKAAESIKDSFNEDETGKQVKEDLAQLGEPEKDHYLKDTFQFASPNNMLNEQGKINRQSTDAEQEAASDTAETETPSVEPQNNTAPPTIIASQPANDQDDKSEEQKDS